MIERGTRYVVRRVRVWGAVVLKWRHRWMVNVGAIMLRVGANERGVSGTRIMMRNRASRRGDGGRSVDGGRGDGGAGVGRGRRDGDAGQGGLDGGDLKVGESLVQGA